MILVALLAAPFLAAVVVGLGSGRDAAASLRLALVAALVPVALAIPVALGTASVDLAWFSLPAADIRVHFALAGAGVGSWLALLTAVLVPPALLAARRAVGERMREFAAALLALAGCLIGAFLAADLVLFYFLFEAGLLPAAILVSCFGDREQRGPATLRFVLYTMLASVPMLIAIWYLAYQAPTTRFGDIIATIHALDPGPRTACFFAFALAFAVKTPLLPLHSWQAPVYAACPAGAAVVVAGAMAKLGTYGFLAVLLPLFPELARVHADLFIALGVISVVVGALLAFAQRDLKRMLAYSSLSHLGLIVVGIFTHQSAGADGALLQMLAHGLAVAALFMLVGHLEGGSGKRGLDDFGAVAGRAPLFAALMVGAALTAVALPGTAGFVGEMQLLYATFVATLADGSMAAATVITALAGASLVLGAVYVLRAVQRVLYGSDAGPGTASVDELGAGEAFAVAAVLALSVGLGLAPGVVEREQVPAASAGGGATGVMSQIEPAPARPAQLIAHQESVHDR